MELLQLREKEVFETLKRISSFRFVVIGGYAVNAYALPRFSVDCDIVVEDRRELEKIVGVLLELGYVKLELAKAAKPTKFARYEKELDNSFYVSFDIFIGEVLDRQSGVSISAGWIFKNSEVRVLKGKTITDELNARIIGIDALFVIKMISCRSTDIRDIFMLVTEIKNKSFIKREVSSRYDFDQRLRKIKEKITSEKFIDGLQGVYGLIDPRILEKSKYIILSLEEDEK
jgi:hypothetical protein